MDKSTTFALAVFLWGCADAPDVVDAATEGGGPSGTSSSSNTTGGNPSTSSGTGGSSGSSDGDSSTTAVSTGASETGESSAVELARGIRLDRLTVNQATQVEIVVDGIEVPSEDYNVPVIRGRRTLVRGFWSLDDDFVPRELTGRLTLEYPDGTLAEHDAVQFVQGPASDTGTASSFQWLLEPEDVVPGIEFRARLIEPDPDTAPGEVSDPPPLAPLAGAGSLGVYDAPLELEVVLVPIQHEFEGCTATPDITDDDVLAMRQSLEQLNPVQTAVFEVREPMVYAESISESEDFFAPLLAALAETRAADNPAPSAFYYGLVDSCDGYPGGQLGVSGQAIAIAGPPTMENGSERIAVGRWWGSGEDSSRTFVHEIGHSQGRRHVACGAAGGIDENYPHPNGATGVWGFGIHDAGLRSPTLSRDYMSYCDNRWVSDYGWQRALDVIEVLTGLDDKVEQVVPSGVVLAGLVYENGTADWWTRDGVTPAHRYNNVGTLRTEVDGVFSESEATISDVPHSSARYVEVDLPADFAVAQSARLMLDDGAREVVVSSIRRRDHPQ